MADMAESKKNMKIDFRPRVVMRVMRLELLIFSASMCACLMLPLYFLKLRPYKEKYLEEMAERKEILAQEQIAKEELEEYRMLQTRDSKDMTLTTAQKATMQGEQNISDRIAFLEREIKREAIKDDQRARKEERMRKREMKEARIR